MVRNVLVVNMPALFADRLAASCKKVHPEYDILPGPSKSVKKSYKPLPREPHHFLHAGIDLSLLKRAARGLLHLFLRVSLRFVFFFMIRVPGKVNVQESQEQKNPDHRPALVPDSATFGLSY